jgi:hypothetical protein
MALNLGQAPVSNSQRPESGEAGPNQVLFRTSLGRTAWPPKDGLTYRQSRGLG